MSSSARSFIYLMIFVLLNLLARTRETERGGGEKQACSNTQEALPTAPFPFLAGGKQGLEPLFFICF